MLQSQSGKRQAFWHWKMVHINPLIQPGGGGGGCGPFWCDVTGDSSVCSQLGTAYVSATTGAVATALGLNALTKVLVNLTLIVHLILMYQPPLRGCADMSLAHTSSLYYLQGHGIRMNPNFFPVFKSDFLLYTMIYGRNISCNNLYWFERLNWSEYSRAKWLISCFYVSSLLL